MTLELLHLEYLQTHPGGYQYTAFCERYRRWCKARGLSMRQVHRGGEKAFVDYAGQKPRVVCPKTGRVREVELFVGVLGASSYTFAEASETQKLADFVALPRCARLLPMTSLLSAALHYLDHALAKQWRLADRVENIADHRVSVSDSPGVLGADDVALAGLPVVAEQLIDIGLAVSYRDDLYLAVSKGLVNLLCRLLPPVALSAAGPCSLLSLLPSPLALRLSYPIVLRQYAQRFASLGIDRQRNVRMPPCR